MAAQEAYELEIDPDQLEDRAEIEGITMASPGLDCLETAYAVTANEAGQEVLRVSWADVASFLNRDSATAAYALRAAYSIYDGVRLRAPMLPRELSEGKLSLLHGRPRPVVSLHLPVSEAGEIGELTFTRDVLVARNYTYDQAETALRRENDDSLSRLYDVSRRLFAMRRSGLEVELPYLEDEDGTGIDSDHPLAEFIVQESTFAVNGIVGTYLWRHGVPTIYRNHKLDFEDEFWAREDPEMARRLAKFQYSAIPQGHLGLGRTAKEPYAYITMPLQSYADFVNNFNLIARLDGRDYPYNRDDVKYGASRLNKLEARERIVQVTTPRPQPSRTLPMASDLQQRIDEGSAHAGDLTLALFGEIEGGGEEQILNLRRSAAEFVAAHVHLARQVIEAGIAKGLLHTELRDPKQPDMSEAPVTVIVDAQGQEYPLPFTGNRRSHGFRAAKLIGHLVGHEITPVQSQPLTPAEVLARDPYGFLNKLSRKYGLRLGRSDPETNEETGEVTIVIGLTLHGTRHSRTITAESVNEAERQGARMLVEELGLAEGKLPPPPPRPEVKEEDRDPITRLNNHSSKRGVAAPKYRLDDSAEGSEDTVCIVEFIDEHGKPQTAVGQDPDPKTAKAKAAEQALNSLPPAPPAKAKNKKKKKSKRSSPAQGA